MARPLRIEFTGAVYHVMARDNHGRAICAGDKGRMWVATLRSDGTEILGQQFSYEFDHIGNRLSAGGRASAASSYTANQLNQYATRTVAPYWDVFGIANPTAAVTANGTAAARQGEYFHHALPIPNSTAQYSAVNVTSQFGATPYTQTNGQVFVPVTPQGFWYDADGNLTNDSRWIYSWDAENRLVTMVACNTNPVVGPQQWLAFAYDWQGRRISKKVGAIGSTTATNELRFVYDGWNLIAILNSSFNILNSFAWGLDLSGSMQGAGGVGGLLWVNDVATINGQPSTHFVSYDGNGNVTALIHAADGSESARYDYGPFGEVIRATGPMARANPIRWSTKYADDETDLVMYPDRLYSPYQGRWLSRDPVEEEGGANLFRFVQNCPTYFIDPLGLFSFDNQGNFPTDDIAKINRRIVDACSKNFGNLVTDTGCLRDCIKKMCSEGKVILSAETPTHVVDGEKVNTLGQRGAPGSNPGLRCNTITLYPHNGKPNTEWGKIAIHESAHCCGWDHFLPGLAESIGGKKI